MAKVTRDRIMIAYAKQYPEYGFESHVGYGTKAHYHAIKKHGQTPIHRKTFIH
jgi:ribonuclease HII